MKINLKQKKLAKNVFKTFCELLDEKGVKYTKNKDRLAVNCVLQGDDLLVAVNAVVNEREMIVLALSPLPFTVPIERRDVIAATASEINAYLLDGHFDFDFHTGNISFRIFMSFANSIIDKQAFEYLIAAIFDAVDEYNDKLLFISKSETGIDDALKCLR